MIPGGITINAKIRVPNAVEVIMTQTMSGIPISKFHRKTKHMSKNEASITKTKAQAMRVLGSISLKNRW
jgi:hypothetical protein